MSKSMAYNFCLLLSRLQYCESKMPREELKSILEGIKESCICIGNGGSSISSHFAKLVLEEKNGIICTHMQPRDVLYTNLNLYKNLFAVTYRNENHGITSALERARLNRLRTYTLTNNEKENGLDTLLYYETMLEKEASFISMASTFMPMTILLKYYMGNDDLSELLDHIVTRAKKIYFDYDEEASVIEIMSGDTTYVASKLLESSITEAGLGMPIVHEKYDYCHGRSTMSYHHPNHILVYLKNGETTELDYLLLNNLPSHYKEIILLESDEEDKIIGEYDLAMKALYFCGSLALAKDKDISKVEYSPVVKQLYRYKGDL